MFAPFALFAANNSEFIRVIEGLGHGHEDLSKARDSSVILTRSECSVTANAKLFQYTEITEQNMDGFHFHGDATIYPVTAVLTVPNDTKSSTLLRGRYLENLIWEGEPDEQSVARLQKIGVSSLVFRHAAKVA